MRRSEHLDQTRVCSRQYLARRVRRWCAMPAHWPRNKGLRARRPSRQTLLLAGPSWTNTRPRRPAARDRVKVAPPKDANLKHRLAGIAMAMTGHLSKVRQKLPSLAQAAQHDLGRPLRSGQLGLQQERRKTTSVRAAYLQASVLRATSLIRLRPSYFRADLHCGRPTEVSLE